jgi:metallo-beta-lactamase class B
MKFLALKLLLLLTIFACMHCAAPGRLFKAKEVFRSPILSITQISENAFLHTSFKQTNDFGNVPCNGLLIRGGGEAIVFDTPTDDESARALMKWAEETLKCKIKAVIPTHFHDDCLGGLKAFEMHQIPSYAHAKTIELAKAQQTAVPQNAFSDSLLLQVGVAPVVVKFFGEGHTKDNVVGYFASEGVLFGGCLIKALQASKGYLGDANTAAWPHTVEKIRKEYAHVKIVVPGHGAHGDAALLDYTIQLFKEK